MEDHLMFRVLTPTSVNQTSAVIMKTQDIVSLWIMNIIPSILSGRMSGRVILSLFKRCVSVNPTKRPLLYADFVYL